VSPEPIPRTPRERFVGAASKFLLRAFFRRIEVVGEDRLPERGPFVVVANHVNGLLDPMFVFGPLGLPARMLGKAPLWKIPVIGQLARLAGGIPVERRHDPGSDPAKNVEAFAAAHRVLAEGGVMAIFPEGISHDEPRLQPLKTGTARIVLDAERLHGHERPLGILIVPVGLVFERRDRFRSKALVVVGEPIDPERERQRCLAAVDETEQRAAVRDLTARIAAAIEEVTLNYESWEEARLVELGADLWDSRPTARPAGRRDGERPRGLLREFALRRAVDRSLDRLRGSHPAEVAEAVDAARAYERLLRAARLTDEQVTARVPWRLAVGMFALSLFRLVVYAPTAILGTALNVVPWSIVHTVAKLQREGNQVATYSIFGGLLFYPATWIAEGWIAGHWLGALSGTILGAVVAPVAGWLALLWHERRRTLWRETRAWILLRGRRTLATEIRARRERVERAIERLAGYLPELGPPASSASSRS